MSREQMIAELKKVKPSYNYDRYEDAQIFRMYQRYVLDKSVPKGDVVTQQAEPVTPIEKSIEDYENEYENIQGFKTCDICGTRLNDMGTCPKCDDGEEDLMEDIVKGFRVVLGSNKINEIIASREFQTYDEAKAFIDEITPTHSGTDTPVDYASIYDPNGSCIFGISFLKAWEVPEKTDEPVQAIKAKATESQKRYPLWLYQKLEDAVAKIDDIPAKHKEEFITLVGDRATVKRIPGIGHKASLLPKACIFAKENGLPCKDYNSLIAHPEYYGTTVEDALRTIYNTMKKRWFKDTSLNESTVDSVLQKDAEKILDHVSTHSSELLKYSSFEEYLDELSIANVFTIPAEVPSVGFKVIDVENISEVEAAEYIKLLLDKTWLRSRLEELANSLEVNKGFRNDNAKDSFNIGDRVAHRWADTYNVGTIKDIMIDDEGVHYQIERDYSDGDSIEWLFADEITHWVDMKESLEESKECCICHKSFNGYGNNAAPVADGICCDDCNIEKVIPARLKEFRFDDLNESDHSGFASYDFPSKDSEIIEEDDPLNNCALTTDIDVDDEF